MRKYILFILLFNTFVLQAQETKNRSWTLNGYLKFMQTISFQKVNENWLTDNNIHNRLIFNWDITGNLTFNTQMRNRIIFGETVSKIPVYSEIAEKDAGLVDLNWNIFSTKSVFMNTTFDRLYLDYNIGKFEITAGRQRINWGQNFIWSPNDLFNSYSFFDFDYEEKPGSDAVRLQFYNSFSSRVDLAVKVDSAKNVTTALLYGFNKWSYDIQFLAGYYESSDIVIGAGFSGSLFKGGLSGEFSMFHPVKNFSDTSFTFVASLGYNYTFANSLMLQFEGLYNGFGAKSSEFDIKKFYFMQLSAKNLSLTKFSLFFQGSYPVTPLLNVNFSMIYNPNDNSWYFGPALEYSLMENFEISGYAQYFTSKTPVEQGGRGTFIYWRLKWSF